jgi:cytochrome oxidase Cu insertion factor (SCO1/SenC/PrrC family)
VGIITLLLALSFGIFKAVSSVRVAQAGGSTTSSPPASVDPGAPLDSHRAPDFTLTNRFGHTASLSAMQGKVVVKGFVNGAGNTVRPLIAVIMRNVSYDLGSHNRAVQFLAVNANPQATSVQDVYQWSEAHHMLHRWQFLTGSADSLQVIWHHYFMQT